MLDSTLELISQAVSNNLYVFCIFNLIIVMILIGSNHGSNFDQDYEIPLATSTYDKQDSELKQLVHRSEQATSCSRVSKDYETGEEDNKKINNCNGNNKYNPGDTNEGDEGDDELRRRIEEFIAKVNREWRAEKLGHNSASMNESETEGRFGIKVKVVLDHRKVKFKVVYYY